MSQEIIRPTGAGSLTELAVSGAATNWEAVAEADPHDGDTTRVVRSFGGSEETPVSDSDTDTYACANPTLRNGTIMSVAVAVVAKANVVSTNYLAAPVMYVGGATHPTSTFPGMSTTYALRTGTRYRNPSTLAAWAMADIDAMEIGVQHSVSSASQSVTLTTTQVYGIVNVFSPWSGPVNDQATFMHDSGCAFIEYLTNTSLTPTSTDKCTTFLSQYNWECSGREPWAHGQATFPRIHVFTERAEAEWIETGTIHTRFTTRLRVYTTHNNPTTAASSNLAIMGAIMAALGQLDFTLVSLAGGISEALPLRRFYANWGNMAFRSTGPRFVDGGELGGICLGEIEATWVHVDP